MMLDPTPRTETSRTETSEPETGYIRPHGLEELWFHTGTACNLKCPFCLEGSKPGDNRLQRIRLADVRPWMEEASRLGVNQFSFTGGEPFVVREFVDILEYAAQLKPCLVLTNGSDVVHKRLNQIARLSNSPESVSFRVSIDYPNRMQHDAGRGAGAFDRALQSLRALHQLGFRVSLARQIQDGENPEETDRRFRRLLTDAGLPESVRIVAFPDFGTPGISRDVPTITRDCMTRYHDEKTRREFMCAFSKMVVKIDGQMRVYACTLVDDDPEYDLGDSLEAAMKKTIQLRHHRCYSCFRLGASCSERN